MAGGRTRPRRDGLTRPFIPFRGSDLTDSGLVRIVPDPTPPTPCDEELAAAARVSVRTVGLQPIPPDAAVAPLLDRGEVVLAVHRGACVERRNPAASDPGTGLSGDLYVTSLRLLLLSHPVIEVPLASIRETGLAGERVILIHADGLATAVDVETPRLLRVEIGAARRAARETE